MKNGTKPYDMLDIYDDLILRKVQTSEYAMIYYIATEYSHEYYYHSKKKCNCNFSRNLSMKLLLYYILIDSIIDICKVIIVNYYICNYIILSQLLTFAKLFAKHVYIFLQSSFNYIERLDKSYGKFTIEAKKINHILPFNFLRQ